MIKKACIIILMVVTYLGHGQTEADYSFVPVSPEAAALSKMVNYPINHNTGVPNINIPFHEVSSGNLKLPIVLNYHAAGFKYNEQSTKAGLGWSLSCDLQITRSINGTDDLSPTGYIHNDLVTYHKPDVNPSNFPNLFYPFYTSNSSLPMANTYALSVGDSDGMPDKFNYKLLDKVGSFYFQKNATGSSYLIVPVPFNNIKISFNETNGTFTIVDTDGTEYLYADKESSNQKITSWKCTRITSNNKIDKIYFNYEPIEKFIKGSFNQKIELFNNPLPCELDNYVQSNEEPYVNQSNISDIGAVPFHELSSPKYWVTYWNKKELHIPYLDGNNNVIDKFYTDNTTHSSNGVTMNNLVLNSIDAERGETIIFNGGETLESINIISSEGQYLKTLKLFHEKVTTSLFYENGQTETTQGTTYLDSLYINLGLTSTKEKYRFNYSEKFDFGNHLIGHDVWGYCNKNTHKITDPNYSSNYITIPKQTIIQENFLTDDWNCHTAQNIQFSIGSDDKWLEYPRSNERYKQRGILKRIVYPTGGSVVFDYESNQYKDDFIDVWGSQQKMPQIAGGLRIRSINYLDENNLLKSQKYYRYGELEEGTGEIFIKPKKTFITDEYQNVLDQSYDVQSYEQTIKYLKAPGAVTIEFNGILNVSGCNYSDCISEYATETKTTYIPTSAMNYTYPSGAPIYYTKVTEYQQDLGIKTGKKVYRYYDKEEFVEYYDPLYQLWQGTSSYNEMPNIPFLKTDWMVGAQKSIENYSYDSIQNYKLISKNSFKYRRENLDAQIKVASAFPETIVSFIGGVYSGSTSQLQRSFRQSSSDYYMLEYGIPVGNLLLTEEKEELFLDQGTITNVSKYYYDRLPNYYQVSRIETTNSQNDLVQKELKYAYDFNGVYDTMETKNMISQLVEEINTNITKNIELSRHKNNYEYFNNGYGFYAPKTIQSSFKGGSLKTDISFDIRDFSGNPLQVTAKDNITTSYLWGYNNTYLVAEMKNINYIDIPSSFKNNPIINNPSSSSALIDELTNLKTNFNNPEESISIYTYSPEIGVTSITSSNDYTTYFEYDKIGRLLTYKDNDLNVTKKYSYNTKNIPATTYFYNYNIPQMRTIGYDCNTELPVNYVYKGGDNWNQFSYLSDPDLINNSVNSSLDELATSFENCTNPSEVATITFMSNFDNVNVSDGYNYPTEIEVDFIQNEFIIATQKIRSQLSDNNDPNLKTILFLKEGDYQVSIRLNAGVLYSGSKIPWMEQPLDLVDYEIKSGDIISLEKGKVYDLVLWNW